MIDLLDGKRPHKLPWFGFKGWHHVGEVTAIIIILGVGRCEDIEIFYRFKLL